MSHKEIKPSQYKPEKWSEDQVLAWCFQNRWDMDKIDAKKVRCPHGSMVTNTGVPSGFSDLCGNTDQGLAAFVEMKKLGFRHICSLEQRQFLEQKVRTNCFAAVVDSPEILSSLYSSFLTLRKKSFESAQEFLLKELPRKVVINGRVLNLS